MKEEIRYFQEPVISHKATHATELSLLKSIRGPHRAHLTGAILLQTEGLPPRQDRLLQLVYLQRQLSGTLAEVSHHGAKHPNRS